MIEHAYSTNQLRWLWLTWLVLILDQFSKWFAIRHLPFREPIVINRFFNLTLDFNQGAAFNFLRNQGGWQIWFFSGIAFFVCIFILIWLKRMSKRRNWNAASLALIMGGALGNLIDRVLHGYVIDFIQWHYHQYYFPTFNIADSGVCVGAVLLILTLKSDKKETW